jgi:hypothetical protein
MKSATAPSNTLSGRGRGRPRKEPGERSGGPGCIWPEGGATCRAPRAPGLALCDSHRTILSDEPDGAGVCTWPGCTQPAFHRLCAYHAKCARGLIAWCPQ